MKKLVAMDGIRITSGSTYDNAAHLAPDLLRKIRELYEGTRLGRQELQGAMILDPLNALFKDNWLIHDDVAEVSIEQATVGVDPSGGADEVGIAPLRCSSNRSNRRNATREFVVFCRNARRNEVSDGRATF
jgi:phage terminase large subunit-like protein